MKYGKFGLVVAGLLAMAWAGYATHDEQGDKKVDTRVFEMRTYYAHPGKMDALYLAVGAALKASTRLSANLPASMNGGSPSKFSLPTTQTTVGYSRLNCAICSNRVPTNGYSRIGITTMVNNVRRSRS